MRRRSILIYAGAGALTAELIVWAILLPWAHRQYTTGIAVEPGLWKPVLLLALTGAAVGLAALAAKRVLFGR